MEKLFNAIEDDLKRTSHEYSQDDWGKFKAALSGILKAFEELNKKEFSEAKAKKHQEASSKKNNANRNYNRQVDVQVKKVSRFREFVAEHKEELISDPDYSLGRASLGKSEDPEAGKLLMERNLLILENKLETLENVLHSKRTNAWRVSIEKPKGKKPYKTKRLRHELILALLCICEIYLKLKVVKSSDINGCNIVLIHTLIHEAGLAKNFDSHNYQEMFASTIDFYKPLREFWLESFENAHEDGYSAFMDFLYESPINIPRNALP